MEISVKDITAERLCALMKDVAMGVSDPIRNTELCTQTRLEMMSEECLIELKEQLQVIRVVEPPCYGEFCFCNKLTLLVYGIAVGMRLAEQLMQEKTLERLASL
jgi:hypothetical protein